jgi:hypothetical protein
MKPTLNDKLIAYLALISGLSISAIAIYYSVVGLIAIYPAMIIPIVVMGVVIELGKLSALVWIKKNWDWAPVFLKLYMLPAIAVLMLVTSVGVFGFLSKAHSDQTLVSGDVQAKIDVYDIKIQNEKDLIDANRKTIKQLDEAVDQIMARSDSQQGAEKSAAIRKAQQKDRSRINEEIIESQKKISALNDERAPIAAEVRKVEADVGPIKYIAAFLYGSNPDANVLEKAVTWVTILIVIVLDPMAVILLLASQYSFQRFKELEEKQSTGGVVIKDGTIVGYHVPLAEETPNPYVADVGEKPTKEELDNQLTDDILKKGVTNSNPDHNTPLAEDMDLEPAPLFTKTMEVPVTDEVKSPTVSEILSNGQTVEIKGGPTVKKVPPIFRTKVFRRPDGYVQNEEQKESNLWAKTTKENT